MVYRETVDTASSYWLWNGKLLTTLRSVLWDGLRKTSVSKKPLTDTCVSRSPWTTRTCICGSGSPLTSL